MKRRPKPAQQNELSKAIRATIDRAALNLSGERLAVHQNPATGKTKISPYGPDCEDGMYQLRWRVP